MKHVDLLSLHARSPVLTLDESQITVRPALVPYEHIDLARRTRFSDERDSALHRDVAVFVDVLHELFEAAPIFD